MSKKLIIANWKMNGSKSTIENFIHNIEKIKTQHKIIICLPHPYLYLFKNRAHPTQNMSLGAQDCHSQISGSYTGDVSPTMLTDMGCEYVILGHSERRVKHNESNSTVKEKATSAEKNNLTPIIAVGERKPDENIELILQSCEESISNKCIIGYEPIWSIGSGVTPSTDQIHRITSELQQRYKKPVVYGGSVNDNNATEILKIPSVSGLLIGKASMNLDKFTKIIQI